MEKDDEISGEGNSYTTHFRQYDPRTVRWISPDPMMAQFAGWSPYNFCFNNPVNWTDIYGDCPDGSDCETMGSKAEKTAADLISQNNGSYNFTKFNLSDEQKSMLYTEGGELNSLGKAVNGIIKDQAYLNKFNKVAADFFSGMVNSGELTNSELTELASVRASVVNQTKAQYMAAIFSPDNIGTILFMSLGTGGSSQLQSRAFNYTARYSPNLLKQAYQGIGSTGKVGETFLKKFGGQSQKYFNTTLGKRFTDQFVKGVAHESKVGYTSLTQTTKLQIAKDVELMTAGQVDDVVWHFFKSPITGKTGASAPLLKALKEAGIKTIIY